MRRNAVATLKAVKREGKGKYVAFDLRRKGRIPGIVYGKELKENLAISLDLKEFLQLLKAGDRIVSLEIDGAPTQVLIKAVQHGTYDHEVLHADFRAISATDVIEVELEIQLDGEAPGLKVGGMLEQNLHSILARCLPKDLPEKVLVDVSALNIGDILFADDLPRPKGVEFLHHGNPAVVSCHTPRAAEEAPAEGEEATAPEVIGEKEREAKEGGDK